MCIHVLLSLEITVISTKVTNYHLTEYFMTKYNIRVESLGLERHYAKLRPRLHESGTKSIRDDLVSVIVLFIIVVYMRLGWKMLRPV